MMLVGVLLLPFGFPSCLDMYERYQLSRNDRPFSSADWLAGDVRQRGTMVNDLLDCELLIHKSRHEVHHLLGDPDFAGKDEDIYEVDIGQLFVSSPWYYYLHIVYQEDAVAQMYLMD